MSYGTYQSAMKSGCYPMMSFSEWQNAPFNESRPQNATFRVEMLYSVGEDDTECKMVQEVDLDESYEESAVLEEAVLTAKENLPEDADIYDYHVMSEDRLDWWD